MVFKHSFETKFGKMTAYEKNNRLIRLCFDDSYDGILRKTKFLKNVELQLIEYCEFQRITFDIDIAPEGTEFQRKIWSLLMSIPYGTVCSYKHIAELHGNPNATRAVGGANNKNPIMLIIPCHRVIGKNGTLVGYAAGIDIKQQLINHEKIFKLKGGAVNDL